ncbi:MAG: sensor histidine kinase [Oscillospiraceae bacterium]
MINDHSNMKQDTLTLIKTLYQDAPSPVFVCDGHLNVLWENAAASEKLLSSEDKRPARLSTVFPHVDFNDIARMVLAGESCRISFVYAPPHQVELSFQPVRDGDRFVAVVSAHLREKPPVLNSAADALSAINSQTYRNALFGIFNVISVLANTFYEKDMYEELVYLNSLSYSCYSIMRANINIGEHYGLTMGAPLQKERMLLNKFCLTLADNIQRLLSSSDIEFRCSIVEEPIYTQIDAGRLTVAILNAIQNSCVFSDLNNVITFSLRKQGESFVITVSDKGVGIPAEELPYVFDPFYTNTQKASDSYTGNGLGLTVVREVVEAHGGICIITSEPYEGTTLSMRIPIEDDPSKELALSVPPSPYLTKRFSTENIFLAKIGKSTPF